MKKPEKKTEDAGMKTVGVELTAANRKRLRLYKATNEGATYKDVINKAIEEYLSKKRG